MVFSFSAPAQSSRKSWGSGIDFSARASKREGSRWSLTEWLAMKERNKMMDMWLSVNAPSPLELMMSASYNSYQTDERTSHTSLSGEFAASVPLVGVSAEYEDNKAEGFTDVAGLFNLRVFGDSIQNTSLVLSYGQQTREQDGSSSLKQQFAQAALQIYLTQYFGVDGSYRSFMPSTSELGEVQGSESSAGVFIDFKALRVFGSWYKEIQELKNPAATSDGSTDRTGIKSGVKLFF